jgi:ribosomal protein S18 acetylase RimI-like enzyme
MTDRFEITAVRAEDVAELATIHITARCITMPYLPNLHTASEIGEWFASRVQEMPNAFCVARCTGHVVGYIYLYEDKLDDLYVSPNWQGRGIGSALLENAKVLSPQRIELSTFQQNTRARSFYEARGFREVRRTDGENEERMPDVQYEWSGT